MSDALIEVEDLYKTYRDGIFGAKPIRALQGVSLQVPRGTVFGLLGPNGAGKTTLIKILLGLVRRTSGDVRLLDEPLGSNRVRRRVGYLPEHHRFPRHLTANSALFYYGGLTNISRAEVKQRRNELMEMVGLAKWGNTPVRKFSKGMQQRLGIAQAILHRPELVILDEPTDGVDPVGRADIRKLLKKLQEEGTTVFLNSHQLQEIELVCDQAAILMAGEVRVQGTIEEITAQPSQQYELTVLGIEEAVLGALSGAKVVQCESREETVDLILEVEDHHQVNHYIDSLRAAQIEILELKRLRSSLEDAFLEVVDSASDKEEGNEQEGNEEQSDEQRGVEIGDKESSD